MRRFSIASLKLAFQPSRSYVIVLVLFIGHQIAQKGFEISIPFVDGYLDPFLSIPLLLGLAAAERKWLFGEAQWQGFNLIEILAMTLALAILFEEGFTMLDPIRQTRDVYDYFAYACGGLAYLVSANRN